MQPISLRGIDLFAGPGGLTLGLKQAAVETVCAVEVDAYCVQTFARHTPGADIIARDIRRVDLSGYKGKIDLVYGGPPCQPFSSGGLRAAAADERDMIPWFVRAIQAIRPYAFLMENVPGLTVGSRAAYLDRIIRELQTQGYVVTWNVIDAADYGAPQTRRRLFVVGIQDRKFRFPSASHGPGRNQARVAVRDVLPPHQLGEPNPCKVFFARRPETRPSPYDGHLFNGGGRPIRRDQPCRTVLASAGGNKTHFFDDLGVVPQYHRHLMEGGAPWFGPVPGARRLTVLESAVLQTFPADMVFCGPPSAQYRQVGDAVPPKLAWELGAAMMRQIAANDSRLETEPCLVQPRLL